jgi:hypothetical protein
LAADAVIALSHVVLGTAIFWFLRRRPDLFMGRRAYVWLCGIFVFAGGLTHAVDATPSP